MSELTSGSNQVTSALVTEAKRIHEDALFCIAGHTREARFWNSTQFWLGIPSTMIAAMVGVASLADPKSEIDWFGASPVQVAGVLSLVSAVLVGLMTFLDPKGQAAKHYKAMTLYYALRSKARIFYEIHCGHCGDAQALMGELQKLSEQLSKLHKQTPVISARGAAVAEKAIRDGTYTYAVDGGPEKPPGKMRSTLRAAKGFFGSK